MKKLSFLTLLFNCIFLSNYVFEPNPIKHQLNTNQTTLYEYFEYHILFLFLRESKKKVQIIKHYRINSGKISGTGEQADGLAK